MRPRPALQKVLDAARVRIPTPGISVAIRLADGRTWLGVSGDRRLSPARPVDQDTVFSIASITKTFVTAVVMQLVAEGQLGLDDRLSEYLPDYPRAQPHHHPPAAGPHQRHRQLLRVGGVQPGGLLPARAPLDGAPRSWPWWARPYCAPGRCFHYSNTNFVLLGEVVERVTGTAHRACHPRTTARTAGPDAHDASSRMRRPPRRGARPPVGAAAPRSWIRPATGVCCPTCPRRRSPGRLGRWSRTPPTWPAGRWRCTPPTGSCRPDLLAQMLDFRKQDEYGLGTRTRIFNGRRAIGHGGSLRGYEDGMWYFPREGAVIVLLSNRGLYNPDRTIRRARQDALEAHRRAAAGVQARAATPTDAGPQGRAWRSRRRSDALHAARRPEPSRGQGATSQAPTNWTPWPPPLRLEPEQAPQRMATRRRAARAPRGYRHRSCRRS